MFSWWATFSARAKWRSVIECGESCGKKVLDREWRCQRGDFTSTSCPDNAGCESLDDIAKDHTTHTDRRADGSGQNKVETDDRQHGCSLGNEIPLHVWNTHECNNCTVTFGQAWYSYLMGRAPKRGNDPVNCVSVPCTTEDLSTLQECVQSFSRSYQPRLTIFPQLYDE